MTFKIFAVKKNWQTTLFGNNFPGSSFTLRVFIISTFIFRIKPDEYIESNIELQYTL